MSTAQVHGQARRWVLSQLARPVFRSGYTLVLHSTVTAALGVAFWLLAARKYSPAAVGRSFTALSAMMFLAGVAQLNLTSSGVYFSWVGSSVLVVTVAAWILFARAIPAFSTEPSNLPSRPGLTRFAAPGYLGSLAWIAATTLVPILVPRMGIVGAGLAWLLGHATVAAVIGAERASRRMIRAPRGAVPASIRAEAVRAVREAGWRLERPLTTVSDTAVLLLSDEHDAAVLKVASTERGTAALRREQEMLRRLAAEDGLGGWRQMVPAVLGTFELTGGSALLTSRLSGRDGRSLRVGGGSELLAAATAIAPLHQLDSGQFRGRRAAPEALGRRPCRPAPRDPADPHRAGREHQPAGEPARRRPVPADADAGLGARGLLPRQRPARRAGGVCGVIDAGQAQERDLPVLDLAHWVLTLPRHGDRREIGARVAGRLDTDPCWSESESQFLSSAPGGGELPGRILLPLTWLRHVDTNLVKSDRYRVNPVWFRRNVIPVPRKVRDE